MFYDYFSRSQKGSFFSPVIFAALAALLVSFPLNAQRDVHLHINSELGACDFDIAPELTQSEWSRATREIGNIVYLDPLAPAAPLGRRHWSLHLESSSAKVDDLSGAWNNTFHHPDSTHYLTGESGRISVPGLRLRFGITDRLEAGLFYTSAKPFGANYGFLGFETKYAFLHDTIKGWDAAARASYVMDANVRDFNVFCSAVDFTGSKTFFNCLSPYAGVGLNWNYGVTKTAEVNLDAASSFAVHGIAGIDFRWKFITAGYGVMFGDGLGNRSFKVGVIF